MLITDDYVSFEIEKLLKEKGFDAPFQGFVTHQTACKWLREVYKLFITIDWTGYENECIWSIQDMNSSMSWESDESYILYEYACEAAIKYCLENLV